MGLDLGGRCLPVINILYVCPLSGKGCCGSAFLFSPFPFLFLRLKEGLFSTFPFPNGGTRTFSLKKTVSEEGASLLKRYNECEPLERAMAKFYTNFSFLSLSLSLLFSLFVVDP